MLAVVPLIWVFALISGDIFSSFLFAALFAVCVYFVIQNRELLREFEKYNEMMRADRKGNSSRVPAVE